MSVSTSSTAATLQRLRDELSMLQESDLTGLLPPDSSTSMDTEGTDCAAKNKEKATMEAIEHSTLLHEYEAARTAFLRSKLASNLLHWMRHYQSSDDDPDGKIGLQTLSKEAWAKAPTDEERENLSLRRDQVMARLQASCDQARMLQSQLQAKNAAHQARKQELLDLIQHATEQEERKKATCDEDNEKLALTEMDDDASVLSVDEEEFASLQDRLEALQEKKINLQLRYNEIQRKTDQLEKTWRHELKQVKQDLPTAFKTRFDDIEFDNSNDESDDAVMSAVQKTAADLEAKKKELAVQVEKYQEIADYYDNLRIVMEELRGMRIIETRPVTVSSDAAVPTLQMTVRLLDKYDVLVELFSSGKDKRNGQYRLKSAKFSQNIILTNEETSATSPDIQLHVPSLDDLVRVSQRMTSVESLRFVLREASARIMCLQARVHEIALLRKEFGDNSTKDNITFSSLGDTNEDAEFGGHDQDVSCQVFSQSGIAWNVLLRMTPDCPLFPGSVYIVSIDEKDRVANQAKMGEKAVEEEVGNKFWQELINDLNTQNFSSPVKMMRAARDAVLKSQASSV